MKPLLIAIAGIAFRWKPAGAGLPFAVAVAILAAYAAAGLLAWGTAYANGASTVIMDRVQGPYRVVVGIIPARPVIPQTHLAIQVFAAEEQRLLRDTEVQMRVTATGPAGVAGFGPRQVRNEQTLRYFEVDVEFGAIGPWDVAVAVDSELGEEEFLLNLEVEEPRAGIQWLWVTGALAAILAVGAWTWLTMRRRRELQ